MFSPPNPQKLSSSQEDEFSIANRKHEMDIDESQTLPTKAPRTPSLVTRISSASRKFIHEKILRESVLPPSKDGRHVVLRATHGTPLIDDRSGQPFINNSIRTSRYTALNFVPKQLFFQFSRVGNFYFLCVGIPQMIPGLSTTGNYTTILPLLFFVFVTMGKEGYDDYRRHRLDLIENTDIAMVLKRSDSGPANRKKPELHLPFKKNKVQNERPLRVVDEEYDGYRWTPTQWSDIAVGDVVRLERDEPVPADMILLHSENDENLAYIETMALDGETNLKSKEVSSVIKTCDSIKGILSSEIEVVSEDPNPDLYNFEAKVTSNGETMPLTISNVVYRGSVLRNTPHAIGLVINTGEECKIRRNANQHPKAKKPAMESVANKIVVMLAFYVIILSVGVSMGYLMWQKDTERHSWYLKDARVKFYEIIIAYIIQFNNVIPLSLYVSLEIVKVGQMLLMNSDIGMYDPESDTPAKCNTNTILENLGQVGYIFTDKTGTLTENVMKFRKLSIAGTSWLHETDLPVNEENKFNARQSLQMARMSMGENPNMASLNLPTLEVSPEHPVDAESDTDTVPAAISGPKTTGVAVPRTSMSANRPSMTAPRVSITANRPSISANRPSVSGNRPSVSGNRPSMSGRRSSSHWRSTGRPDHVQPDVTSDDLLEYIRLKPHSLFARKAKQYILAMALCHTCLPEIRDGELTYQASSPDELALVTAASEMGYSVVSRTSQSVTLRVTNDDQEELQTYEILDVIEFSSVRKRMSIVVRFPDGRIAVICKGADSTILPRLKMANVAMHAANEVRKSADMEHEMLRRSLHEPPVNLRKSLTLKRNRVAEIAESSRQDANGARSRSFEANRVGMHNRGGEAKPRLSLAVRSSSMDVPDHPRSPIFGAMQLPEKFSFLEDASVYDEMATFTRCFKHLDDFATEGLRTLLYAQRFITEADYKTWKAVYHDATTSLVDRQALIEAAGELIEQNLDLVGASAIEDKLQKGVPETIEKLRRAHIKIWMLTGDKRETAINIAHSARVIKPGSDLFILDVSKGSLSDQLHNVAEDIQAESAHSVVVIDGQTLSVVEQSPELSAKFYAVMPRVDSVICCRASPAQKALLVTTVRSQLKQLKGDLKHHGLTLAIGDGANDLAMISASHVGVGISGKEGLQAARVADFAIAQFRFLQRLLLLHGRWNYSRASKFTVSTFWKEMFFYLPTALYQRYNGYTGTSLYEYASLTVFNTLFTSLCCICMGIWDQDLSEDTLLAMPELYSYGQRNKGLNQAKFLRWMLLGACEGAIAFYGVWAGYGRWIVEGDNNLYAMGSMSFTVGVLWVNWKLIIFETHYKPWFVLAAFFITTAGWWAWLAILSLAYSRSAAIYNVRDGLWDRYGSDVSWWATLFATLGMLGIFEFSLKIAKRKLLGIPRVAAWTVTPPWKSFSEKERARRRREEEEDEHGRGTPEGEWRLEIWQEMEQDAVIRKMLKKMARDPWVEEEEEADELGAILEEEEEEEDRDVSARLA
ncbi:putative phospholipid-transporting ATPase DNF3 [Ceratocystis fimbriata CBS 114723]|uniref:Phospholipid-transporting ATPase n=1 Tax=Ceratocystis fimbriata CBS 114723 TaxID=1035309 RepID=A0A2C5WZM5_9PEZI|nr:putative phospholipid-transporting ATPase DNF3 [Ceratocystis fimbriata CBS 114723]